jgi:hypothetical protein
MQPRILVAVALLALTGCQNPFPGEPKAHGPQWIDRPVQDLIDANGKPDRIVRLPPPSLSSALLYLGGAEPGFAVCERDYFVRGKTIVGYSEHGTDPKCSRHAGNLD